MPRAPLVLVFSLLLAACTAADSATIAYDAWPHAAAGEPASGDSAMVVTDAPLATDVGLEVLRAGGNAVDATVAIAFALAVVYPEAGNIGGGGFMVTHLADGTMAALDFRERAPLMASRDMFLDSAGNTTDLSRTGHLAAGVPGAVKGLWEAHRRFGTRPWTELLAPAIRLARDGFTVSERLHVTVRADSERLSGYAASAALFLPDGSPPVQGSIWRNTDLATVLERIADSGPAGFYEGATADLIMAEMRSGGGLIAHEDLRAYEAKWREPVVFDYRGLRVISMPPPSSGGLTLALMANMLEGWNSSADWHQPETIHRTAEAMRRAFAERNQLLGDPDFVDVPAARFLSEEYAGRLRASIDPARATPSDSIRPGLQGAVEGNHTTHFSVVDALGNAVALTTTINDLYGSAVTVAGAGFLLNDEMDDFTSRVGQANMFGLVQGEANAIVPGKRMLSAMTPTIVLDSAGAPLLITGARGGPRIITAVLQVLSNVLDYGMPIDAAVRAPRIHHQHLPDVLWFETRGMAPEDSAALVARGHDVRATGGVGHAPAILRTDSGWVGMPDPRNGGKASGY